MLALRCTAKMPRGDWMIAQVTVVMALRNFLYRKDENKIIEMCILCLF
jgi:hypothetical protein